VNERRPERLSGHVRGAPALGGSAGGGLGHRVAAGSPAAWWAARSGGGAAGGWRLGLVAARAVAARSRCPAWSRLRRSSGRRRGPGPRLRAAAVRGVGFGGGICGARGDGGVCSSFYEGPVVAADPVARRRPVGAPGPTNKPNAGEKGLLCQRPGRWRRGARAARNRVAAWSRSPAPAHPRHPPARPGLVRPDQKSGLSAVGIAASVPGNHWVFSAQTNSGHSINGRP
jgi:hypothetical protein